MIIVMDIVITLIIGAEPNIYLEKAQCLFIKWTVYFKIIFHTINA